MPPANNTSTHIVWVSAKTLQQQKTVANPSRIDKVIAMVTVAHFLTHGVCITFPSYEAIWSDANG